MTWVEWILVGWGALGSLVFGLGHLEAARALRKLPRLADERPPRPERWPTVTAVVAACNEEATLEPAIRTLLGQDYPRLEVVLVDDRSTDRTPVIVDAMAEADTRVRAVHVRELPEGWLGKHHALHRGTQLAGGDWLLFCDADVRMAPETISRAVAFAQSRGLDHLPVLPRLIANGFWFEVTLCTFGVGLLATLRASKLNDPASDTFAGVGAFNLVRAAAFRRTEGFEWLRMEIADDVGLGLMLSRAGAKNGLANGTGVLEIEWYSSLSDMASGLEKNMFGVVGHFSYPKTALRVLLLLTVMLSPVAAVFAPVLGVRLLGTAALGCTVLVAWRSKRYLGVRLLPALLLIPGALISAYIVARSAYRTWRQGGVSWRGTRYPLEALRAGQRVKL